MLKRPYSTISIRNKNNTINSIITKNTHSKMNIVTLNNNNNNNVGICQSPKLKNGKMRYLLENKKLFSLLDLNEKITNSKGPSLPIQFKRLNSKEINDLFNADIIKAYKEIKKLNYSKKKEIY